MPAAFACRESAESEITRLRLPGLLRLIATVENKALRLSAERGAEAARPVAEQVATYRAVLDRLLSPVEPLPELEPDEDAALAAGLSASAAKILHLQERVETAEGAHRDALAVIARQEMEIADLVAHQRGEAVHVARPTFEALPEEEPTNVGKRKALQDLPPVAEVAPGMADQPLTLEHALSVPRGDFPDVQERARRLLEDRETEQVREDVAQERRAVMGPLLRAMVAGATGRAAEARLRIATAKGILAHAHAIGEGHAARLDERYADLVQCPIDPPRHPGPKPPKKPQRPKRIAQQPDQAPQEVF